jgi:Lon protease-like protein
MLRRSRVTTHALLLLATVAALAAITGCGGHSATRQDVVARANAICFTAQQAARSVASPGAANTKALAAYFDKVVPIVAKEARQLAALPRPKQRQATLNHYVDAVGASVADYRAAARAAAAGDAGGVSQALARLQSTEATRYARAYGLNQCTGSASATS